jgi:hypothetical protein
MEDVELGIWKARGPVALHARAVEVDSVPHDLAHEAADALERLAPVELELAGCFPSAEFGPNRGKNEERVLDSERG